MKIFRNSVLLITILAIISNFLGFIREVLIAYIFGAEDTTDAFYIALTIPTVVLAVVGNVLMTIIVPIYSKYREDNNESRKIISSLFTIIICIAIPLSIILVYFSLDIIDLLGTGLSSESQVMAYNLLLILIPIILFGSLMHGLNGVLESHSVFGVSAFSGVINNFIVVIGIIGLGFLYEIYGVAIATVSGFFAGLGTQLYFWKKIERPFSITFKWNHPAIKEMAKLSIPVAISTLISQSYLFTDRYLASFLEEGSVTALNFASKLSLLPIITFAASLSIVTYTKVTNAVIVNDKNMFQQIITKNLNVLLIVMLPIALIFLIFSGEIVNLMFRYGNFDYSAFLITKNALVYYSIGILPNSLCYLLYRVYYAHKRTLYASIVSIIGVFTNIIMSFIFVKPLDVGGIALANSVSFIIILLLLLLPLKRFTLGVNVIEIFGETPKLLIMVLFSYLVFLLLDQIPYFTNLQSNIINRILVIAIPAVLGLIIYILMGLLLRHSIFMNTFKKLFKM